MWKKGYKYGILIPWLLLLVLSGCDSIGSLFQGPPEKENLTSQDSSANGQNQLGRVHCDGYRPVARRESKILFIPDTVFCSRSQDIGILYNTQTEEDSDYGSFDTEEDSWCGSFASEEYSLMMLDIPYGTTDLTLYITIPGGVPGLSLEDSKEDEEWQYTATLGTTKAKHCGLQGFPDRLYCSFTLPTYVLGTTQLLEIKANTCPGTIFSHPYVSILPPGIIKPNKSDEGVTCSSGLGKSDCLASGGSYIKLNNYICVCP